MITLFSLLSDYSLPETRQSVFHVFYFPAGGGGGWHGVAWGGGRRKQEEEKLASIFPK